MTATINGAWETYSSGAYVFTLRFIRVPGFQSFFFFLYFSFTFIYALSLFLYESRAHYSFISSDYHCFCMKVEHITHLSLQIIIVFVWKSSTLLIYLFRLSLFLYESRAHYSFISSDYHCFCMKVEHITHLSLQIITVFVWKSSTLLIYLFRLSLFLYESRAHYSFISSDYQFLYESRAHYSFISSDYHCFCMKVEHITHYLFRLSLFLYESRAHYSFISSDYHCFCMKVEHITHLSLQIITVRAHHLSLQIITVFYESITHLSLQNQSSTLLIYLFRLSLCLYESRAHYSFISSDYHCFCMKVEHITHLSLQIITAISLSYTCFKGNKF